MFYLFQELGDVIEDDEMTQPITVTKDQEEETSVKEFVEDVANLECPEAVKEQLLGMLQSWASAFSSDAEMVGVSNCVAQLKERGIVFPEPNTQDIILTSSKVSQCQVKPFYIQP